MAEKIDGEIAGEWVEVREQGGQGRLVFYRSSSALIPPARGRRMMHLYDQGDAETLAPGPTDKAESAGFGGWVRHGDVMYIRAPGWEGEYEIEALQDDKLVLRRR